MCLNNHFIILLNINTFYAFFLQKTKTYYLCLILTSFLDCVIREILGSVLKPPFLCKCCSAIRREEVCKQVGCERERLTLYINNTNFPLINMQQLKHIIFQDLLNEPRIYSGNSLVRDRRDQLRKLVLSGARIKCRTKFSEKTGSCPIIAPIIAPKGQQMIRGNNLST